MLKPCRRCQKPTGELGALCSICKTSAERARPSRHARGYGAGYAGARARVRARAAGALARGEAPACVICGLPITSLDDWTAEHIQPLRHGGTSDESNLGDAHAWCNYGWRRKAQ